VKVPISSEISNILMDLSVIIAERKWF
jgi:hypothetical protein